jgi:hypothetical protein
MGSGEKSRDTVGNAPAESELSFGHFVLQFPVGIFQRVDIYFYGLRDLVSLAHTNTADLEQPLVIIKLTIPFLPVRGL